MKRFSIRWKFLAEKKKSIAEMWCNNRFARHKVRAFECNRLQEHRDGWAGRDGTKSYCEWLSAFCIRWTGRLGFRSYFTRPDLIVWSGL